MRSPDRHPFALAPLQTVEGGLEDRKAALAHMEADCEALSRFVTPGEAGHIRATLTRIRCHWDELKRTAEQLEGQLNQSVSYRQRYSDNLEQVRGNAKWNEDLRIGNKDVCGSSEFV